MHRSMRITVILLAQLVFILTPLTAPVFAADHIVLLCSGRQYVEDPNKDIPLTDQTLIVDLENKTVTGFLDTFDVTWIGEDYIALEGRAGNAGYGSIERSGKAVILDGHGRGYDLTCTSSKLPF